MLRSRSLHPQPWYKRANDLLQIEREHGCTLIVNALEILTVAPRARCRTCVDLWTSHNPSFQTVIFPCSHGYALYPSRKWQSGTCAGESSAYPGGTRQNTLENEMMGGYGRGNGALVLGTIMPPGPNTK